tara:strand:- start:591 stop:779 length:189 start_codon:yes stop_codon:yes gene_type:complete
MSKKDILGASFEELGQEEMMELDGGAATTFLSTTTLPCVGGSIIISAGVSLITTITVCKDEV